jgi:hypothetical protein
VASVAASRQFVSVQSGLQKNLDGLLKFQEISGFACPHDQGRFNSSIFGDVLLTETVLLNEDKV